MWSRLAGLPLASSALEISHIVTRRQNKEYISQLESSPSDVFRTHGSATTPPRADLAPCISKPLGHPSPVPRSATIGWSRDTSHTSIELTFRLEKAPGTPALTNASLVTKKQYQQTWTGSPSTRVRTSTVRSEQCRTRSRCRRSISPCTRWRTTRK